MHVFINYSVTMLLLCQLLGAAIALPLSEWKLREEQPLSGKGLHLKQQTLLLQRIGRKLLFRKPEMGCTPKEEIKICLKNRFGKIMCKNEEKVKRDKECS